MKGAVAVGFLLVALLVLALPIVLIDSEGINGEDCIGVGEERNPSYKYELDKSNVAVAALFFQTVYAPIWVIAGDLYCPTEYKGNFDGH